MANRITIEYKGVKYHRYPDAKRRQLRVYYQHHGKWKEPPVFLHRKIYEDNFGPIPAGYHIHHKDGNTENNSPDNLQALPGRVHAGMESKKHWDEHGDEMRAKRRDPSVRKKISESHKNLPKKPHTCELCGEVFVSSATNVRFCPDCAAHRYSDKYGRHFKKSWQLERFGRIVAPYIVK